MEMGNNILSQQRLGRNRVRGQGAGRPTTSYDDFVNSILQKLGLQGMKRVQKLFYRILISVLQEIVKYDCLTIASDEDLQVLFHCRRQFPEVRTPELLAKLVDVVSSSGGSNRNTHTICTVASSSSRPVGVALSVPVNEPPDEPVAFPSFAVDLNCSGGGEVGIVDRVTTCLQHAAPAGMGDALLDGVDDDDVELDLIADDNGDDIAASNLIGAGGGSKFQVGQQFQDKDEVVLSVKPYSIRRGVQYKVVESDYRRYVGKCSEFGNGCTWLIRLSLRQRKGIWEVKRYNGPHTCLATSISSDHRSLDYHVISAFIMPMVRADASVIIKVLLNATAAHFGFRPTYRRVWLAKQKAVAHIYGNWVESYNELPLWVLGVQLMMPGSVAVLRTSPVRVRGQVDDSQAYFHRISGRFYHVLRHSGIASR
ncbi:uncharacterized protein LOC107610701 [Arachis ipaensis]|uniref:uncharacterized protein LOC107610701 n=1 Tax=Arachis ipaensis TaxID=130454 RepID=UPI0007AF7330|nr:uncharacterized protein LOC107610701 [Arachis ipaensis]